MPIPAEACADRPNLKLAALVDDAMDVNIEYGTRAAANFLAWHRAGFALTVRVLAGETRRRARS